MNRILILLFLSFNFCAFGQTQHEMHKDANNRYKKSDNELNKVYQKILTEYKSDSIFINRLKKTQKIWPKISFEPLLPGA